MRNQEDEMLKKCLRQTMEQIQPDEETKNRMYLEIMRRASAAENANGGAALRGDRCGIHPQQDAGRHQPAGGRSAGCGHNCG